MHYDIVVVGAGPAGLSFARLLARSGLRLGLIDTQSSEQLANPRFDGRDIALTHQSVRILQSQGIWARVDPDEKSPIRSARVEDGTSPYSLDFDPASDEPDALGYLVSNHLIRQTLYEEVQAFDSINVLTDTAVSDVQTTDEGAVATLNDGQVLHSRLIVAADSRFSDTRRKMGIGASMHDFGRVCIVCRMQNEKPHDNVAFECFHYGRTLAVLPLSGNRSSVVITAPMDQRGEIMGMDEASFNRDIENRFGSRLGHMKLITERHAYPLVGVHAQRFCGTRFALVGDSAVGMHPVTAHGYNLGLSGAEILASEIIDACDQGADIGATSLLERYETRHMRKTQLMYRGTNEMVRFFTDDRVPVKLARQALLRFSNNFPPIKRVIRNLLTQREDSAGLLPPLPPLLRKMI